MRKHSRIYLRLGLLHALVHFQFVLPNVGQDSLINAPVTPFNHAIDITVTEQLANS